MSMCYSPSTGGFYRRDYHGDAMPQDCITITDAEYMELFRRQADGWQIQNINGRPQAVLVPVTMGVRTVITSLEFRRRFSATERAAITLEASHALERGDPTLQVFLDDLASAGSVDLTDPEIIGGVEYCAGKGLITPRRADTILGR